MPSSVAVTTMQTTRAAMALADRVPGTCSGNGNAGGTTAVAAAFVGRQVDYFRGKYLLLTSGTNSGEWREIIDFTSSSGTFTVDRAYTAQVASAVTFEVYSLPIHAYKLAANRATARASQYVWRMEEDYLTTGTYDTGNGVKRVYGMPRGMRNVFRVSREAYSSLQFEDKFSRADSTTDPGDDWTATAGTWGVSSERLYSVTDANADFLTFDRDMQDGHIQAVVRGTLNSGSTYRSPALAFRIRETYANAVDTTNCLIVRLLNGSVDLRKNDGGSESSLATYTTTTADATDYLVAVRFFGNKVFVWLDENLVITYELTGLNLKYLDYPRAGIRLDKANSGAQDARVDDYRAHVIVPFVTHPDWEASYDARELRFGDRGTLGVTPDTFLRVEGAAPFSQFAADTTYGTAASDTTATLEIDPERDNLAWLYLIEEARAELYDLATDPAINGNLETIPYYAARRDQAKQRAIALRESPGATFRQPNRGFRIGLD